MNWLWLWLILTLNPIEWLSDEKCWCFALPMSLLQSLSLLLLYIHNIADCDNHNHNVFLLMVNVIVFYGRNTNRKANGFVHHMNFMLLTLLCFNINLYHFDFGLNILFWMLFVRFIVGTKFYWFFIYSYDNLIAYHNLHY